MVPDDDGLVGVPFGVKGGVGVETHGVVGSPITQFGGVSADVDYFSELGFAGDLKADGAEGHCLNYELV